MKAKKMKVKVLNASKEKKCQVLLDSDPEELNEETDDPATVALNKRIAWLQNELAQARLKKAERQLELKRSKTKSRKVSVP